MKMICKFLIVILFFSMATVYADTTSNQDLASVFTDPRLETRIKKLLYKGHVLLEPIPVEDLKGLIKFDISYELFTDLTGLEYCTNLEELYLKNYFKDKSDEITDLSPLSELDKLKVLRIQNNKITDISPLSTLVNLEELYLNDNGITDLPDLSTLVNLKKLDLNGNGITDISPLSTLVNLEWLNLYDNKITDISPLSQLVNLKDVNLNSNGITDLPDLSTLVNLKWLNLRDNKIANVSPLLSLPGISKDDSRELVLVLIDLDRNELSRDSIMIYIPLLEERVKVEW